jgi:RP/EB family microtubule-associated protein
MSQYGTMDGAYFVSKNDILGWLNQLLGINYTKVEQCANGAAYCQVFDAIYPGEVPMKKVVFEAKAEHDSVKNYKVLQTVFDKKGIAKAIDVTKLLKGKPMDNLEFLQWLKRYYDINSSGAAYNGPARRGTASEKENEAAVSVPAAVTPRPASAAASKPAPTKSKSVSSSSSTSASVLSSSSNVTPATTGVKKQAAAGPVATETSSVKAATVVNTAAVDAKIQELTEQLAAANMTVHQVEQERDYYFAKLRQIEIKCQTSPDDEFSKSILETMYRSPSMIYASMCSNSIQVCSR